VENCGGSGVSLSVGAGAGVLAPRCRPRPPGVGVGDGVAEGDEKGTGVGVVGGKASEASLDGALVGAGEVEISGLDVALGTGGGGGVPCGPGAVCAKETALVPNAVKATAANAIMRKFKSTPRG